MEEQKLKFQQFAYENHVSLNSETDEFLIETAPLIGFIIHDFNLLDETLNRGIWEQISDRSDERGAIITETLTFSAKIELFKKLSKSFEIGFGYQIPILNSLIEDLKKAATFRNAIVHAEWYNMNENGYTFVKLKFEKDGLNQHYWQFSKESLLKIIDFINATLNKFSLFWEEKQDMHSR